MGARLTPQSSNTSCPWCLQTGRLSHIFNPELVALVPALGEDSLSLQLCMHMEKEHLKKSDLSLPSQILISFSRRWKGTAKSSAVTHTIWILQGKCNVFPMGIILETYARAPIFHFK